MARLGMVLNAMDIEFTIFDTTNAGFNMVVDARTAILLSPEGHLIPSYGEENFHGDNTESFIKNHLKIFNGLDQFWALSMWKSGAPSQSLIVAEAEAFENRKGIDGDTGPYTNDAKVALVVRKCEIFGYFYNG